MANTKENWNIEQKYKEIVVNFINTKKGLSKYAVGIIVACTIVYASTLFWRYGAGIFFIQGLVLLFVLMYASISDIRTRIVGDFVPVEILILSLICFSTEKYFHQLSEQLLFWLHKSF